MKKSTKFALKLFIINVFLSLPVNSYAQDAVPEKGISRIEWAVKCCGTMPRGMIYGFIILAVLITASVIYAAKDRKERKDEK